MEPDPIPGLSTALQYPYYRGANQADVYYWINLQVDMSINIGMYNGEIRRRSLRHIFRVNVKQSTTVTIGANVSSNGRVSHKDIVV